MQITQTLIRATAEAYTLEELETLRREAIRKLAAEPDYIATVSTGGGASYARQQRVPLSTMIELYQQAIDYKKGLTAQADIAQFATPVIYLLRR